MALFVLGDPHLSLGASKPMDIFPGWNDYVERLEKNWRKLIQPEDTIAVSYTHLPDAGQRGAAAGTEEICPKRLQKSALSGKMKRTHEKRTHGGGTNV